MSPFAIAKFLLIAGIVLILGAGLVYLAARFGFQFGKLPGDIVIQRGNGTVYIPITSSILASVLLSIVLNLVVRFLNR